MHGIQLGLSLAGIVIVIFAAYYVTYFIGVKAQGINRGKSQHIKLLSRFSIAKDKSFCIVEIAGSVYVVGITNNTMTLLDKLDSAAFAEFVAESGEDSTWPPMQSNPFSEILKVARQKTIDRFGNQDKTK